MCTFFAPAVCSQPQTSLCSGGLSPQWFEITTIGESLPPAASRKVSIASFGVGPPPTITSVPFCRLGTGAPFVATMFSALETAARRQVTRSARCPTARDSTLAGRSGDAGRQTQTSESPSTSSDRPRTIRAVPSSIPKPTVPGRSCKARINRSCRPRLRKCWSTIVPGRKPNPVDMTGSFFPSAIM